MSERPIDITDPQNWPEDFDVDEFCAEVDRGGRGPQHARWLCHCDKLGVLVRTPWECRYPLPRKIQLYVPSRRRNFMITSGT